MAVATSIIVGGIIAGSTIAGAKIAASGQEHAAEQAAASADKAAALQTGSTDKALALQKEMFDLQRQDLAPYRALGAGATGRLGELWGFPTGAQQLKQEGISALPGVAAKMGIGTGMPAPVNGNNGVQPLTNASTGVFGRPTGTMPSTGLTVKLQAPDGEVSDVPSEQAQHYIRLGARQIG